MEYVKAPKKCLSEKIYSTERVIIMKKTKHTLLTAMTFTAALQMASASNVNAVPNDNAIPTPSLKYDPAAEDVQDVYGPAPYYGEDPVTTAVSLPLLRQTPPLLHSTVLLHGLHQITLHQHQLLLKEQRYLLFMVRLLPITMKRVISTATALLTYLML